MKRTLARLPDRTLLLWLGNGLAGLLLLAILAWKLAPLLSLGAAPVAELRPLTAPGDAAAALPASTEFARNPFDPAGTAWHPAVAAAAASDAGNVKGVIVLPGVTAVVTDGATVRVGEALAGGKLVGVQGEQLVLDNGGSRSRIDLPGAQRPQLKDLNRSAAPACKDSKC